MNAKLSVSLTLLLFVVSISYAQVDCSGGRYSTEVFAGNVETSNVLYGSNFNLDGSSEDLKMDIYQPAGDSLTSRALVIMAHGGSFIGGDKADGCTDKICKELVKYGYVTASINYRIGMGFPINEQNATRAVYRATHDARAAVRFFRKDFAENGNTYGIDTSQIYFGGQSAGAFMAIHMAYLNDTSELPPLVDTTQIGMGGGMEGNSGNPGYSSRVNAIINMSGALVDTAFMKPNDIPILSFHGDQDVIVPYGTAIISVLGFPLMEVDGSSSIAEQADKIGVINCFKGYPGASHVPECGGNTAYYDTSMAYVKNWMLQFVCNDSSLCTYEVSVGIDEKNTSSIGYIRAYPNPTNNVSYLDLSDYKNGDVSIHMYDYMGRMVRSYKDQKYNVSIERGELAKGVYHVEITDGVIRYRSKIIFQ